MKGYPNVNARGVAPITWFWPPGGKGNLLSLKSLDADLDEAFALTPRPHGEGLVESWPCARQEFPAVFHGGGRLFSFCKAFCHHFLDNGAECRIDLGLIVTVCAAAEKLWAPPT